MPRLLDSQERRRRRSKVIAAFLLSLPYAVGCLLPNAAAHGQHETRGQARNQTGAGGSSGSRKYGRPKRGLTLRNCDTPTGSRQTIKFGGSLNDYSAYRTGDDFYVVLPKAASGTITPGVGGRDCYSVREVHQRGSDVVLIYRLKSGVEARAEQTLNRLDVVFEGPEDATDSARQNRPKEPQSDNIVPPGGGRDVTRHGRQTVSQPASLQQPYVLASPPPVVANGSWPVIRSIGEHALASTAQPEAMLNSPPPTHDRASPQPSDSSSPTTSGRDPPSGKVISSLPLSLPQGWRHLLPVFSLLIVGIGLLIAVRRRRKPPQTMVQPGGESAAHSTTAKSARTADVNTAPLAEETPTADESKSSAHQAMTGERGSGVESLGHVTPADESHAIKAADSEAASKDWMELYLKRGSAAGALTATDQSDITGVKTSPNKTPSHTVEISSSGILPAATPVEATASSSQAASTRTGVIDTAQTSPGEGASAKRFPAGEPSVGHSGVGSDAPAIARGPEGFEPLNGGSAPSASIQQRRLNNRGSEERAAAVAQLSALGVDEAFRLICAAFADEAETVRSAAARALYDLRNDPAELFARALREVGNELRPNLGAAINSSGLASEAISQLTAESSEKSFEAFSILFVMATAGEIRPLTQVIEAHPSNDTRLAVVKLLALSGHERPPT